jgi:hypothetical protein
MKKLHLNSFKVLAKINKILLPSLTKNRVDPIKATKFQFLLLGWRYYVTKNSLD